MPDPKPTKKALLAFLRVKLATDDRWILPALMRIFQNQTEDEQQNHETKDHNGIGFTGTDAEFLSSCAEAYRTRNWLSEKRMHYVRLHMPKYAGQILKASDPEVLERSWRKSLRAAPVPEPVQSEFALTP